MKNVLRMWDEAGELPTPGTSPAARSLLVRSFTFCLGLNGCMFVWGGKRDYNCSPTSLHLEPVRIGFIKCYIPTTTLLHCSVNKRRCGGWSFWSTSWYGRWHSRCGREEGKGRDTLPGKQSSDLLPSSTRSPWRKREVARSLSFHRANDKCVVQLGFLYVWFSSLNQSMNGDVKLQIPLTLVKCFKMLVEGARTVCAGTCV